MSGEEYQLYSAATLNDSEQEDNDLEEMGEEEEGEGEEGDEDDDEEEEDEEDDEEEDEDDYDDAGEMEEHNVVVSLVLLAPAEVMTYSPQL